MKRPIVLLLWAASLVACAHTYETSRRLRTEEMLERDGAVYVARPEAGTYGHRTYERSPEYTVRAIADAFREHASTVAVGAIPEAYEGALESARSLEARYAVVPEIEHWEDRATEWSGKSDRLRVDIHVYDVATGEPVDSVEIEGRSRWLTFGGDHPQDLLDEPVADYVDGLYGAGR